MGGVSTSRLIKDTTKDRYTTLDIVSSYPHKYRDAPLPYGLPGVTHTMPEVGYWESVFWARLELKKDKVPWYTPKRVK